MTIHVKDGGTWKEASLYVRDGGVWKAVNEGYVKDAGTWKQFFVNRVTANITISSNTSNYVLNTAKVTGYVAGKTDVTLTINSGVFVSSSSTGSYALTVDTSWSTGDTLTIINNGTIIGRGGTGGNSRINESSLPGSSGGPALLVQRATSINNLNRISGGGGGGGAGQSCGTFMYPTGGSGGGGIGVSDASPTPPSAGYGRGGTGTAGTLTSAGSGGSPQYAEISTKSGSYTFNSGAGGNGGTHGSSGSRGGDASGSGVYSAGNGGAGGAAVVGNSNITWVATGTRNGSIS